MKASSKRRGASGGFTLVELLVVIVILAVLAGIVVFAVGTTTSNAAAASCSSDATTIETALSTYDAQMGTYPADISGLLTSTTDANGDTMGPWLRSIPGGDHYVFLSDNIGSLYVVPPNESGPVYDLGSISGPLLPGKAWDVDTNPSICSQFS